MVEYIQYVQWPAMFVTITAAWLVTSHSDRKRNAGFWCFLLSNSLWILWGWYASAHALIVLQLALAATNIRGAYKSTHGDVQDVETEGAK
jgi:hypothetical protein